jgi:hypothetical protein
MTMPNSMAMQPFVEQFTDAISAANPNLLGSYLRAAGGFGDLPIHYPRLLDQAASSGEHFRWFVQNEREAKRSLPDLSSPDVSL